MSTSAAMQSMYSAPVPDSIEDDNLFAIDHQDGDDDAQSWDIAAFSKISVVTVDGDRTEDDNFFDADFPASFDFPGTADDLEGEEDEKEEEDEEEEQPKQEEEEEQSKQEETNVSEERVGTPIPMTPDSNRSVSSKVENKLTSEVLEEESVKTDTSDIWADVGIAVQSAKTVAKEISDKATHEYFTMESFAVQKSGSVEEDSVPTVSSSSFDSSTVASSSVDSSFDNDDDNNNDDDDHGSVANKSTVSDDASHASGAASVNRSVTRIRAFFAKRSKRSDDEGKKSSGSVKSIASKDKSTASSGKKLKMKLKGMSFRAKENADTSKQIDEGGSTKKFGEDDLEDDDIVESLHERQTRVYKIMRKKPREFPSTEKTSFLEDLAEEFLTCSYFFKCLGEVAVKTGGELEATATSCCRRSGDVNETVEVYDDGDSGRLGE